VVHFPIAWLIAALIVDLLSLVLPRASWAETTASCLYPAGAVSALVAFLTGRQAGAGVLIPGMGHAILINHWNWALATTIYFGVVATLRLALTLTGRRAAWWTRAGTAALGLAGILMLFYTSEQGARLVYEQGVGTVPHTQRESASPAR
jgi:uncharacterized membrane protein